MKLKEVLDIWYKERAHKQHKSVSCEIALLTKMLGNISLPVDVMGCEQIRRYLATFSSETANKKIALLRRAIRHVSPKYIGELAGLRFKNTKKSKIKPIKNNDIEEIAKTIRLTNDDELILVFDLLFFGGFRISELKHLKREGEKCVIVRHAKTHHETVMALPHDVMCRFRTDVNWERCIRKLRGILKPYGYSPHSIRHTAALRMLKDGVPLPVVSYVLGHTAVTMTNHYVNILYAEDKARNLYD